MEVSKLTISDNLKIQGLGSRKKGKKILELLKEAELDGRLAQAKNRKDLFRLAGYVTGRESSGGAWASQAIKRGNVIEELDGFENGKPVYRYRLSQKKFLREGQSKPREEQNESSEEQSKPREEQSKPLEKNVKLVVGEVSLDFTLSEKALIGVIKEIFKR